MFVSSLFAFNCLGQTWDIKADFPAASGFTIPYNGWTIGTEIVTSSLYAEGDYDFDTFSQDIFDANVNKVIYKLGSSSLTADPNIHAFINRSALNFGSYTAVLAYGSDGCVALRSYIDSNDPQLVTERYDSYLRWTAPATGKYYIQMGIMFNSYTVKVTFSINGKPLEGYQDIESLIGVNAQRINWFQPSYQLTAGDVVEMRLQAAGTEADWKTSRVFGVIVPAPEYIVQDSFEDPALPGWVGAVGGGVVTTDYVRSGTYAVEFPWGNASDYRRMTLKPFAGASDGRDLELKIRFYEMPTYLTQYNGNVSPGLTAIDSKGSVIRVSDTKGVYTTIQVLASNHQLAWTSPSAGGGWNSPPAPYARVWAEPGWNEFRATVNSQGHVTMYMNDIPAAFNPLMNGFRDIIIGQWKGKDYEGPNVRTIFDDLEVKALARDEDKVGSLPVEDPNIVKLNNILFLPADLDRNYRVEFKDLAIIGQNWLAENDTDYAVGSDIFFNMEYGNLRGAVDNGGWGRSGAGFVTHSVSRSGNEALSIPKGRYGRLWREFWAFNNNNCTVTAWLYYPANTYVGPLEINLLEETYSGDALLRVYAGYAYDPENPGLGTNVVKTTQGGSGTWVDSTAVVNTGWNKVQFVLTPENGTDVYFNNTLIRNFTPAEFPGTSVIMIGKGYYYDNVFPDKGVIIFDDVSVFNNVSGVAQGDPDAIYPAGEFNLDEQVDFLDMAEIAGAWLEASFLSINQF
jgi:hypothetical protein